MIWINCDDSRPGKDLIRPGCDLVGNSTSVSLLVRNEANCIFTAWYDYEDDRWVPNESSLFFSRSFNRFITHWAIIPEGLSTLETIGGFGLVTYWDYYKENLVWLHILISVLLAFNV